MYHTDQNDIITFTILNTIHCISHLQHHMFKLVNPKRHNPPKNCSLFHTAAQLFITEKLQNCSCLKGQVLYGKPVEGLFNPSLLLHVQAKTGISAEAAVRDPGTREIITLLTVTQPAKDKA